MIAIVRRFGPQNTIAQDRDGKFYVENLDRQLVRVDPTTSRFTRVNLCRETKRRLLHARATRRGDWLGALRHSRG